MIRYILILLIALPLGVFSQPKKVTNLSGTSNGWVRLALDWHYQKGDNPEWAKKTFDDSSWPVMSSQNLNMPDSLTVIAKDNEIAWFRKYIKIDSLSTTEFVLDVYQQGASEIYLDGKLIHKLGTVSSNPNEIINLDPGGSFLPLKLTRGVEHVLAVRYINSQYKYPENRRVNNTNGFMRIFATTKSLAYSGRTLTITDSTITNNWRIINQYWRYKVGDDPGWSQAKFDDSSWTQFSNGNLNIHGGEAISQPNDIAWFRKPVKLDSSMTDAVVMRVFQSGASEIYLDGELIYKLGTIGDNLEKPKKRNPLKQLFKLPLVKNKEHQLAIRFQNIQSQYPIQRDKTGFIGLYVTSLNHALAAGMGDSKIGFDLPERERVVKQLYLVLGIGLVMLFLFFCLFIFFPQERINAYFTITNLFFCVFILSLIIDFNSAVFENAQDYAIGASTSLFVIPFIICIYKIFEKKFGLFFWIINALCLINFFALFYFSSNLLGPLLASIALFELLRISIITYKKDRSRSTIFLISGLLNFIFWVLIVLDRVNLIQFNTLEIYQSYAYALLPMSIAVYLGYKFGKRSQQLRLNLERVQKLSSEKESILSKQNETLEQKVNERTNSLNQSLEDLKNTQNQLIQSEKMASLGELTAGIAHEIQNPLNFVNNFSEVSKELLDEMKEEIKNGDFEEVKAIMGDVVQNLEKINHHGQRADSIVKGMLQHSRASGDKKEDTDINALVDEYLRLAYHGFRAKDQSFNATLKTDYDPKVGTLAIIPQDIGRVILNLLTNGFYAIQQKAKGASEDYTPTVGITTKKEKAKVLIEVSDNGGGIPANIVDKIFQPFFTTKPTGEGTGLGLSMSYDIVTKGHGGEFKIETQEGEGTKFIILLKANQDE